MKLNDIPDKLRQARTLTLKYIGFKLKQSNMSKNVKRKLILELDVEILMKIDEMSNQSNR